MALRTRSYVWSSVGLHLIIIHIVFIRQIKWAGIRRANKGWYRFFNLRPKCLRQNSNNSGSVFMQSESKPTVFYASLSTTSGSWVQLKRKLLKILKHLACASVDIFTNTCYYFHLQKSEKQSRNSQTYHRFLFYCKPFY